MKKLLLGVAIASALGLSGCESDTIDDLKQQAKDDGVTTEPLSRIVFDPANAVLAVPNDLLFSGTTDGTINMPAETAAAKLMKMADYTDPSTAIGALDGWSTIAPFVIDVVTPGDVILDAASVFQPGAVRIFEAVLGGPLSPSADCQAEPAVSACSVGTELTFGVDFVTKASGTQILIVPIKPLKAKQGYLLAVTTKIKDENNNSIAPSSTYESVRMDVTTHPLPLPSQLGLQVIINSYENGLSGAGVDKEDVVYSAGFTTQSISDVLETAKLMMLNNAPTIDAMTFTTYTAGQMLVGAGAIDLATIAGQTAFATANLANMYVSTLHAPYYLEKPSSDKCSVGAAGLNATDCPQLFSRFQALGDSPVTVLGALQSGVLTQESFGAQYAAQAPAFGRGPFTGNPAMLVGMNFSLDINGTKIPLDMMRHTTKFNPILRPTNPDAQIKMLVSMPNLEEINKIRTLMGKDAMEKPAAGWPVLIYQHGITTTKETLLPIAGALANAGIAVVAIDHPLHGERAGMMTVGTTEVPLSASSADGATAYLNLASLLTGRDNLRQSELDLLALRMSLWASPGAQALDIDPTNVSFYGHSLGGITGITFAAMANSGLVNPSDGSAIPNAFAIKAVSLLAPGGGIPGLLLESPSFAPVVKKGLTGSATFQGLLEGAAASKGISKEDLKNLKDANSPVYTQLVDAVYAPFSLQFNFAAQTIIDAGDPINYASTLAGNTDAIHLMEVVGDGADNKPDQVIPNVTVGSPLAGTEPLVAMMGLQSITETTAAEADKQVSGVVRFTDGHHSSILTPNPAHGGNTLEGNTKVLIEMQKQLASFIASGGTVIPVFDADVVKK